MRIVVPTFLPFVVVLLLGLVGLVVLLSVAHAASDTRLFRLTKLFLISVFHR